MKNFVNKEYKAYLDNLRDSGEINMFGATPYLMEEFDLSKLDARKVLSDWMKSYE